MAKPDQHQYDPHLKIMAKELTKELVGQKGFIQKKHVEKLVALEDSFRKAICEYRQTDDIYKKFIVKVAIERKNILSARPFFREKSGEFSKNITPAIKSGNYKALQQFHINYNMVEYIHSNWRGHFPKRAQGLYEKIKSHREDIIQNNIPLAINRAKLFYRKVPKSHLTLMDFISIACMGLISGVDKYVGAYTKVFNGVCIGRMTGNMISDYSETTLYFFPSDRSLLYRANAIRFRNNIHDLDQLAKAINESYDKDREEGIKAPTKLVTSAELSDILAAASPISTDASVGDEEDSVDVVDVKKYAHHDDIENRLIKQDLLSKTGGAIKQLDFIYQKVIKLKGVDL